MFTPEEIGRMSFKELFEYEEFMKFLREKTGQKIMTDENKLPDIICAGKRHSWHKPEDAENSNLTKYIRADIAEARIAKLEEVLRMCISGGAFKHPQILERAREVLK
jgi:hypothetical protein